MADLPRFADKADGTGDNSSARPDRTSAYSTPRWVKVFGIILIVVLILVFLIQHLVFQGMGGHMP